MRMRRGVMSLMGRVGILCFMGLIVLCACGGVSDEERAALASEGYFRHLIKGEYEQFMEGKYGLDQTSEDYREQMLAAYKQHMAEQDSDHRGILDVHVSTAKTDTSLHCTNVFLIICYGDSTNEEIVVPMVERNGSWRMK